MTGSEEDYNAELTASPQSEKKCRGEKRVSFPPDEEIVSGFAERKDFLRDVDSITLKEIIASYKQSCEKHQVEPKPKLLEQLQTITDLHSRVRCLDLKDERLDYQACESLEGLLKLLQYEFLNLQEAELDENGASALFDMISYYESATHLNISCNKRIGALGWRSLSHLIQQSSCLWRLDACNIPVLEYPAQAMSRALQSSRLAVLHFEKTCVSGRPLFTLVSALKLNTALQELYLADNDLNSFQDSMQLGDLLKYNHTLRVLDLSNNLISDTGLEDICEGLKVQKTGLRKLVLWNNLLTFKGMTHLARTLPFVASLETLNLGQNILQNKGIQRLKDALIVNRSLLQLGLASTKITCEGAVALAEFIAESPRIQRLDVRKNLIRAGGLMALSLALQINRSLIRVDLDKNVKKEKEEFLVETQKTVLQEIWKNCMRNAAAAKHRMTSSAHSDQG
ncbi:protein phosphatase 1 regulatory subunit 37-like [Acipenser ruthenus]|uniref:protein phosphatase 1 regulatory subunit 37-like n=1 Tax=Acipenser ruthenus TaxID=7906 RepID=UPI00155F5E21|nr:protein phosphatase 1 regulatory subunit 37-like [Acipenser ruthenus]XP_058843802.1 protein phosphatase 1 regulatory subunit 37-like [Acipenser ruthenus]